jgi:hypothetical protein
VCSRRICLVWKHTLGRFLFHEPATPCDGSGTVQVNYRLRESQQQVSGVHGPPDVTGELVESMVRQFVQTPTLVLLDRYSRWELNSAAL